MDYLIGMLIGYFFRNFTNFIEKLSNYNYNNVSEDWDFFSVEKDDLP